MLWIPSCSSLYPKDPKGLIYNYKFEISTTHWTKGNVSPAIWGACGFTTVAMRDSPWIHPRSLSAQKKEIWWSMKERNFGAFSSCCRMPRVASEGYEPQWHDLCTKKSGIMVRPQGREAKMHGFTNKSLKNSIHFWRPRLSKTQVEDSIPATFAAKVPVFTDERRSGMAAPVLAKPGCSDPPRLELCHLLVSLLVGKHGILQWVFKTPGLLQHSSQP